MALTEEDMKMWQGVSDHLTRMENNAEYRKKIEKQLYRGAPKESIERIRQVGIKNGQSKLVGAIKKIDFSSNAELIKIQDEAIVLAENSLVNFLKEYNEHPNTAGGRYICSDTFKELFPCFEAKENRALVNDAIHNSSAVLAATQFEEVLKRDEPNKTKAIFITGIPGAGKTTSVKNFMSDDKVKLIFEGQLANPAPTIPKIEQCLQKRLDVTIAAVHIEPEKALDNTFKRFNEYGRGGSIEVMSSIQGNLPSGLKKLKEHFGDKINIIAIDRNSDRNKILTDEKEVYKLISIGSKEEIFKRLKTKLDQDFQKGRIDKACFAQANETKLNKIMPNRIDPTEIAKFKSELE
ncbi:hypothetical protein [uncultured Campylobacter sp.]|uniref:hypothetical protein n=1 Tax=uncultured Campylobacter sp. TaxID=218934 RepID=UPI0015B1084C|nr:hypothetical protein [uncultured Campylobacter sp.]